MLHAIFDKQSIRRTSSNQARCLVLPDPSMRLERAPALLLPMTMLPRRSRMSGSDVASARMAMISDDTVMSKPVSLHRQMT